MTSLGKDLASKVDEEIPLSSLVILELIQRERLELALMLLIQLLNLVDLYSLLVAVFDEQRA